MALKAGNNLISHVVYNSVAMDLVYYQEATKKTLYGARAFKKTLFPTTLYFDNTSIGAINWEYINGLYTTDRSDTCFYYNDNIVANLSMPTSGYEVEGTSTISGTIGKGDFTVKSRKADNLSTLNLPTIQINKLNYNHSESFALDRQERRFDRWTYDLKFTPLSSKGKIQSSISEKRAYDLNRKQGVTFTDTLVKDQNYTPTKPGNYQETIQMPGSNIFLSKATIKTTFVNRAFSLEDNTYTTVPLSIIKNFNRQSESHTIQLKNHLHINGDLEGYGTDITVNRGPISRDLGLSELNYARGTPNHSDGISGDNNTKTGCVNTVYPLDTIQARYLDCDEGWTIPADFSSGIVLTQHGLEELVTNLKAIPKIYLLKISHGAGSVGTVNVEAGAIRTESGGTNFSKEIARNQSDYEIETYLHDKATLTMTPDNGYYFGGINSFARETTETIDMTKEETRVFPITKQIVENELKIEHISGSGNKAKFAISKVQNGSPNLKTMTYYDYDIANDKTITLSNAPQVITISIGASSLSTRLKFDDSPEVFNRTLSFGRPHPGKNYITPGGDRAEEIILINPPVIKISMIKDYAGENPYGTVYYTVIAYVDIYNPNSFPLTITEAPYISLHVEDSSGAIDELGDGNDGLKGVKVPANQHTPTPLKIYSDGSGSTNDSYGDGCGEATATLQGECHGQTGEVTASGQLE